MRYGKIMFCGKCGASLPDGAAFCGACGAAQSANAPVAPAAQPVQPPVEQVQAPVQQVQAPVEPVQPPVQQVQAPIEQAQPEAAFVNPFMPQEQPAAPKKKGKGWLVAFISLVAAAAVFVVCIAGPLWFGWFPNTKLTKQVTKWFGSDDAYMSAVEAETVETLSDTISKGYGNTINAYKEILTGNKYATVTTSLQVGDTVRELLLSMIPETDGVDAEKIISLLNGASITIEGGKDGDVYAMAMALGLGGTEIIDVDVVLDMINQEAYVGFPVLTDIYVDVSQIFDEVDSEDLATMEKAADVLEALPSEEAVNKLLSKYIQLALDQFDDVTKDSDTIKVGGIEEKVTVLKTKITQKDVEKVGDVILEELKDDKDVKDILITLGDAIGAMNGEEDYGQELYEEFKNSLGGSEAMKEDVAVAPYARDTDVAYDDYDEDYAVESDESYIVLTNYVNASHEIIGRKLSMHYGDEKQEMLYYATASKGADFAFEMEINGVEVMTGEGTNKKGIINGTYQIQMVEDEEVTEIATIKVSNFDSNGLKENRLKGSFTITFSEELMGPAIDQMGLPAEITSALSLLDGSLQIDVNTTNDVGTLSVSLCNGSKVLLGIKMETALSDKKISVPDPDEVIDIENIEEWIKSIDLDALVSNLKKAGVPTELVDMLEQAFDVAMKGQIGAQPSPDIGYDEDWYDEPAIGEGWYDEPTEEDWYDEPIYGEDWYDEPVEDWYDEPIYNDGGFFEGSI